VVALLPGSRAAEIEHLASRFFGCAACAASQRPAAQFVLPAVPNLHARLASRWAQPVAWASILSCWRARAHAALAACDVTLVASGTATLEAALFKRPMVIAYAHGLAELSTA
jgi:lipid-A-disaccharide synthase